MPDASTVTARQTHKRCPDCRRVLPAEAFYLRPDGYLSAYCKADKRRRDHDARQRSRPTGRTRHTPARGADNHRLPAAPLLAAVRRYADLRHLSLRELLGYELFAAYGNAHQAGTIRLVVLERFCDEVLGWHPGCSTATPTTTPPATASAHDRIRRPTDDPRVSYPTPKPS